MMLETIVICYLALISCTYAKRIDGLTVDLIHRDSPQSPLYDPNETTSVRFLRSHSRAERLSEDILQNKNAVSTLVPGDAQYLIRLLVGSPKQQEVVMMIDTGSDLVWMECQSCRYCRHKAGSTFDPYRSDTYLTVPCDTKICREFLNPVSMCNGKSDTCSFNISYEDNSYALGEFASDTFTFNSTTPNTKTESFPILFGCATETTAASSKFAGIAGLDDTRYSLVNQLGYDKFSYCLVRSISPKVSKLHFGADADIVGGPVSRTPISRGNADNAYYLTLEAFTVGPIRLEYPQAASSLGNILIDSGTPLTYLHQDFYKKFELAIEYQIQARAVRNVKGFWRLCYIEDQFDEMPKITVHFKDADVPWGLLNTFIQVAHGGEKYLCLAAFPQPKSSDRGIYGSIAQTEFKVMYDINAYTVSFKPQLCGYVD